MQKNTSCILCFTVLTEGLTKNFTEAKVEIVDCPDLTQEPFTLAAPGKYQFKYRFCFRNYFKLMHHIQCLGLDGHSTVLEVGGPSFLLPIVQKNKLYDIQEILNHLQYPNSLVIGAGAGPWPHINSNCEV